METKTTDAALITSLLELDEAKAENGKNLIKTKFIGKRNADIPFGTKGETFFLADQHHFRAEGTANFVPVAWYELDTCVVEGVNGECVYRGMNKQIFGHKGVLRLKTDFTWVFEKMEKNEKTGKPKAEQYRLVNPDSVYILDAVESDEEDDF